MATVFTPEHSSLDKIFAAFATYIIPPYQRPYSWQAIGKSDKDDQVIKMWDDLWQFFEENLDNNKEYFLGSMVIIEKLGQLRTFEVIDGQQRLTTLLLLLAAMRCFLRQLRSKIGSDTPAGLQDFDFQESDSTLRGLLYNKQGSGLMPQLKVKLQRSIGPDFDTVLNNAIECKADTDKTIPLAGMDKKHREIALRYFRNRDYFLNKLKDTFLPSDSFGLVEAQKFNKFFTFLQTRVAIVLIKTTDFETAYWIFEIINNRGLPLTNLDLLRNLMLKELSEAKVVNPESRWDSLQKQYAFTEEFVGRWSESLHAAQPRTSAFNDLKKYYEEHYEDSVTTKKALRFITDLEQNLSWYSMIVEADQRIEDLKVRHCVEFIQQLGNERYSTDLLLAVFRYYKYQGDARPEVAEFLRHYLKWALYTALVGGRYSSPKVYDAIKLLNESKPSEAKQIFILDATAGKKLEEALNEKITDNSMAKLLVSGYVWQQEETLPPDVIEQKLVYDKATLEHILPQEPAEGTNWMSDFSNDARQKWTYRLGNMTLLTQSKNSANRNFDFAVKQVTYAKTKLGLTKELATPGYKVTETALEKRQSDIVSGLKSFIGL